MSKPPTKQDVVAAFQSDKFMNNGLWIIIGSTLFFAFAGALSGWLLGLLAPDYYRVTLDFADDRNAASVGLGLGVTQGAVAGIVVGAVVVLAAAWYKSRIKHAILSQMDD